MNRLSLLLGALCLCLAAAFAYHFAVCREKTERDPYAGTTWEFSYNAWMIHQYGKKNYSQHNEELIIRDFFNDRREGVFLDVGASHFSTNNTTYFLEKELGWRGVAIDAISSFEQGYHENRPNTQYFSFYVSDHSEDEVDFYINLRNDRLSSGLKDLAERQGKYREEKVYTITLNDLLEKLAISRIDFLSMDIELAEPAALAGFDIEKYRPALVCIEAHPEVREQLLTYFETHNYKQVEKYVGLDPLNFYFTPKTVSP